MIKAIIFDFDGTLVDTESAWYYVLKDKLQKEYAIDLPLEQFVKGVGTVDNAVINYINKQVAEPIAVADFTAMAFAEIDKLKNTLPPREGICEIIKCASMNGYKLAIATCSKRDGVERFLQRTQLRPYFDVIKTADDSTQLKPHPEIYRAVLRALQLAPIQAIAIEDSVNGALSAVNAGIHCYVVANEITATMSFPEASERITSFEKLHNELFND